MSFLFDLFHGLVDALGEVLQFFFRTVTEPAFGAYGWIGAIILLTLAVRVALLPLAVKQTKSMKAMQSLQPEMKKIQAKFKTDKGLARSDPEKYRAQKAKQQEATMALYKEHNVNPAASCLPLVLQMPIFFALYRVLIGSRSVAALETAPWFGGHFLSDAASQAGVFALVLIAFMGITTFVSQRQMQARQTVSSEQASQQKILLYAMPVMLTVFGFNLPVGVLVYWVTTNLWTMGQQWLIFRSVTPAPAPATDNGRTSPASTDKASGRKGLMSRLQDMAAEQAAGSEPAASGNGGDAVTAGDGTKGDGPKDDGPKDDASKPTGSSNGRAPDKRDGKPTGSSNGSGSGKTAAGGNGKATGKRTSRAKRKSAGGGSGTRSGSSKA